MRLVNMAQQQELAASMEYLTFAMGPVLEVERKLWAWKNVFDDASGPESDLETRTQRQEDSRSPGSGNGDLGVSVTSDDEDDDDENYCQRQDRRHLAEAWRFALLLYIQRVFKWDRRSHRRPPAALQLTCAIVEHTRNCRKTSQAQKQLLLPIFLAGAEARDQNMRDTVRSFCLWWGARSRYRMFYSVLTLLDEYWNLPRHKSGNPTWWGSFLDEKSVAQDDTGRNIQFLFG